MAPRISLLPEGLKDLIDVITTIEQWDPLYREPETLWFTYIEQEVLDATGGHISKDTPEPECYLPDGFAFTMECCAHGGPPKGFNDRCIGFIIGVAAASGVHPNAVVEYGREMRKKGLLKGIPDGL